MEHPLERFASYHAWLQADEGYAGQIRAFQFTPERGATPGATERYAERLDTLGIRPYRHQSDAWEALAVGRSVVLATSTSSGKSLAYQLPILEALDRGERALMLFPTKALAHDQLGKLRSLADRFGQGGVVAYDGDTPRAERPDVRESARCLLTNPDMLHYGILPFHYAWRALLSRLSLIVIDEVHSYRGVLGVHAANILRRLLRLARHHGAEPRIVATSATVANPAEHLFNLTGVAAEALTEDHAPSAAREFLFWQPPDVSEGRRRSVNTEAAGLAARFVREGVRAIFFTNSRKGVELLRRYASDQLGEQARYLHSYRAGYTAADRRAIETGFREGDIRVLTATSALELGVDIGGVDAVVMVGYPGSLMALRQRAGRAGRGARRALTLLIPGADPLDEFYLQNPERLTEGQVERAVADPFNEELHPLHLRCAAYERSLSEGEGVVAPWIDLDRVPGLVRRGGRWGQIGPYPHRRIAVRGGGGREVQLRDGDGRRLGRVDLATALRDLHPGAVHLHQGEPYLVARLDLEEGRADLLPHMEPFYTQPRSETEIEVLDEGVVGAGPGVALGQQLAPPSGVGVGRVRVTQSVTGYVRKRYLTEAILEERALDLPPTSYQTQALWLPLAGVAADLPAPLLPAAMHALEHTLIGLLPAFVLCERADVGGVSYPLYPPSGEPTIFIYDGYPGGVGYAQAGAAVFATWLAAAVDLLGSCPCKGGCPRCVLSPKCGNGNQILDKGAARQLGEALLSRLGRRNALEA
jgi:DEAD/DEAH box helicase domain-containing protein